MGLHSARPATRWCTTNLNTSSFGALAATITKPSGNGILELTSIRTGAVPCRMKLAFVGVGSDNDVYSARFTGWVRIGTAETGALWLPFPFLEVAATLGTLAGLGTEIVPSTERFADTITIVTERTLTSDVTREGTVEVYSPANNTIAHIIVEPGDFELIQVQEDQTTGTPTANVLVSLMGG